jgi:citrate lyase synthetase
VVERLGDADGFVSATRVRTALARGSWDAVAGMVPETTLALLQTAEGRAVAARLRGEAAGA